MLAGLVDFAVAFVLLLLVMAWYGIVPGLEALFVIPLVLLAFVTALGVGLWLAALNVQYRDVRYVLPFLTQLWLFATPIVYPSSLVPAPWRPVYGLNPMVGVVDGFRWALLGSAPPGPGPRRVGVRRACVRSGWRLLLPADGTSVRRYRLSGT